MGGAAGRRLGLGVPHDDPALRLLWLDVALLAAGTWARGSRQYSTVNNHSHFYSLSFSDQS